MKRGSAASSLAVAARPPLEEYARRRKPPRERGRFTPSSYTRAISFAACLLLSGWLLFMASRSRARAEEARARAEEASHATQQVENLGAATASRGAARGLPRSPL